MKKFLALLLAMVMVLAVTACGKTEPTSEDEGNITEQTENVASDDENEEADETQKEDKQEEQKEDKTEEVKPSESKPAEKPAESKPAEKPAESKPAEKPAESKPAEKPAESKPAQKPAESKPAEKPAESKPAEKPAESKPAEKPAESKPAESKPAESKPAQKPAESKPAEQKPAEQKPAEIPKTVGNELLSVFKANASGGALSVAEKIVEKGNLPFMAGAMPVEPGFLPGFDNAEIKGFKSGAQFGPMMGSIAFVGYVFELEDGTSASDFIANLKKNANLRWNICVEAEEMVTGSSGNKVFFVMCPKSFEQ